MQVLPFHPTMERKAPLLQTLARIEFLHLLSPAELQYVASLGIIKPKVRAQQQHARTRHKAALSQCSSTNLFGLAVGFFFCFNAPHRHPTYCLPCVRESDSVLCADVEVMLFKVDSCALEKDCLHFVCGLFATREFH